MKPEWLERLEQSLVHHAQKPSAMFAQLATIDLNNRPANRTVVFRSFRDSALCFTTRKDSEKVAHLQSNPWAELCWYFTDSREQYRMMGKCHVSKCDYSETIWRTLSDATKQMFTWPTSGEPLGTQDAFRHPVPVEIAEQFVLLTLEPVRVDVLDLKPSSHHRKRYDLHDGIWSACDINP
jgi:PPOX class probable FMN-dependent enzyme